MYQQIQDLMGVYGVTSNAMLLAALGLGVIIAAFGMSGAFAGVSPQVRRLHEASHRRSHTDDFDLVRGDDNDPNGFLKAFIPSSRKERTAIGRRLRQAGIQQKDAIVKYYLMRAALGIGLPCAFIALKYSSEIVLGPLGLDKAFNGLSWIQSLQIVGGLTLLGFYLPTAWLAQRVRRRRRKIWESFPNALDLLQISIEAGMGFDAAIVRVSHELSAVAPPIAEEFMMLELEIQAGKDRNRAFADMAERTGVQEVKAFTNVMMQAAQFGTSVSDALNTYASEMRLDRELRAQEKANRLPVQMSGVIALCMMPALLMICLSPMVIRWMRMFPN